MFKTLGKKDTDIELIFEFDGKAIRAAPGMSVSAALLAEGIMASRKTPVSGTRRGPYCMMGACYECLVLIDGATVQACATIVREGLVVSRVPSVVEGEER